MPAYAATTTWQTGIAVTDGDVVQNTGLVEAPACPGAAPAIGDAVTLQPGKGVSITTATALCIRSTGDTPGEIRVVRGL